ncbi:carbon-nitrogen family hydrolase [Lentilactobacillus farraginis]|uniref:Aliphatic amidase AmiE n=1 Tax=Lentilactobacillus farraginis DSM 18382 = JCM 14108 TaxID=1423743 RepID=X0PA10_9LACO|nr:carbon-nitrogen family hydrolase [Lentilactobacillus farraginis]KRM01807.1 cyanide hydratase [Lentilactobacillus farraginis DSM 18382 = JCM 14108]GAF36154.1 aliphatic amidase AmiE [Lentilactobacillus farraginis DSM 18382 = JCM 14108]
MKLTISLAQLDIFFGNPDQNFAQIEPAVKRAAEENADVVVFPEMWNTGYDLTRFAEIADPTGQRTQNLLAGLAKKYHLTVHGGSVATADDGAYYNTTYIYGPDGRQLAAYRKVHLFGLMREDQYLAAGHEEDHFQVNGIDATSVICYDIRFPEWLRTLSLDNSRIIFVPAEWPTVRIPQWRRLLAARAIENQSFVVAVNRVGSDPDNQFGGHSGIYNPLGDEILTLNDQPQLKTVTIDTAETDEARGFMPVFADRRPELYR